MGCGWCVPAPRNGPGPPHHPTLYFICQCGPYVWCLPGYMGECRKSSVTQHVVHALCTLTRQKVPLSEKESFRAKKITSSIHFNDFFFDWQHKG